MILCLSHALHDSTTVWTKGGISIPTVCFLQWPSRAASGNWNWVNSNSRRPCFRQPRATPSPFGCSFKTSSLLVSYLGPSFQFCKQQQKQIELKPNNYTSLSEKEVSFIFLTGGSGGERLPNPEKGNGAHTILMGLSE